MSIHQMLRIVPLVILVFSAAVALPTRSATADDTLRDKATGTMRKAAEYYHGKVAKHGGYVYYYSLDLTQRLGEGVARPQQIWVQPPGTPTVGLAYLKAYEATGERFYLDAATDAAIALTAGQFQHGGWTNQIDFGGLGERAQVKVGDVRREGTCSLDDGQTQTAMQLMMRVDRALDFEHPLIHESAQMAVEGLLHAQFNNGAFPQIWRGPISSHPVLKASYPKYDWRTEGRVKEYWDRYTLNDGLAGTVTDTLLDAYEIYDDSKCQKAVERLGTFLILAQMPEPQPGWAQQYGYEMHPIWARKFEPAAIAGRESQDVIKALMVIARFTKNDKYLEPIPAALKYLRRSVLSDGRLARYYELETNKPLYMSRQGKTYSLTYDDSNLPSHYGWKVENELDELQAEYEAARRGKFDQAQTTLADLEARARLIVADLDNQGRWITAHDGRPLVGQPKFPLNHQYIGSATFSDNLETLAEYLTATK